MAYNNEKLTKLGALEALAQRVKTDCADKEAIHTLLGEKVDKVSGKGLSSNDYTDADKAKLADLTIASDTEVQEMLNSVFGA